MSILNQMKEMSGRNIRQLFFGLIIGKIDYGLLAKESIIHELQQLQNKALLTISEVRNKADQLHSIWKIPKVAARYEKVLYQHEGQNILYHANSTTKIELHEQLDLENRKYRIWRSPDSDMLRQSYKLHRTSTTDGKWTPADTINCEKAQAYCDGSFKPQYGIGSIGGVAYKADG
jgi:hypothetical protein